MTRPRPRPRPLVIAHRGACGYLPEHSLAAKAMAHAFGADFIEQDVVATADDALIVLHDIHLDRVTDVAARFPGRARPDGRFYARDFTLEEIRMLRLCERTDSDGKPVFAERFPAGTTALHVPTLAEELTLIRGMNRARGRHTGVYPEIKKPAWHRDEGIDLAAAVIAELDRHGYDQTPDEVWLQCFDFNENKRIREELNPEYRLVQLLADNSWGEASTDFAALLAPAGLAEVARCCAAIGPWLPQLYRIGEGKPERSGLCAAAHACGLAVHPYTLRRDALPPGFGSFETLVDWLVTLKS